MSSASYCYDENRDISPVLVEPVLSISQVLESGVVPAGNSSDEYDLEESDTDTSIIMGRVVDPFDAIEASKALEHFAFDEKNKHLSKKAAYERQQAIADALKNNTQTSVNP